MLIQHKRRFSFETTSSSSESSERSSVTLTIEELLSSFAGVLASSLMTYFCIAAAETVSLGFSRIRCHCVRDVKQCVSTKQQTDELRHTNTTCAC